MTTKPNATIDDLALKKEWGNSAGFEAYPVISKNETITIGRVAPQYDELLGRTLKGGADQILARPNAPTHQWTKFVKDTKTGKVYSIDEFKKTFPDQVRKGKK